MEERIKTLESNLSSVSQELIDLKNLIVASFKKVDANFGIIGKNLSAIEKKINELKFKVDSLDTTTSTGLNEVGTKIESLTEEITKIGAVTKYDEMFKNQKGLGGN
jgi:archaellum component FlaC